MTGYKPQPGYILIKKLETGDKSDGLIFVDDKEKPNAKIGKVVEISDGNVITDYDIDSLQLTTQDVKNSYIAKVLKKDDIVVYKKYVDFSFMENGEEYVFIKFEDIIAIKEDK